MMKSFIFYSILVSLVISVSGKEHGEVCANNAECTGPAPPVGPDENLVCVSEGAESRCRCKSGFVKSEDVNQPLCLPLREKLYEECLADEQCSPHLGPGSICSDKKVCDCQRSQSVPKNDSSVCISLQNFVGGECLEAPQCQVGLPGKLSDCVNGFCACSPNSGSQVHRCKLLVNAECDRDDDLCAENSRCSTSDHCSCEDNATPKSDLLGCLKHVNNLGGECVEDRQCQLGVPGNYSHCVVSEIGFPLPPLVCQCIPDAFSVVSLPNKCLRKGTHLGDDCERDEQCVANLSNSTCTGLVGEKQCGCLKPFVAASNNLGCVPKRKLGESCTDPNQCNYIPHSASCRVEPPEESGRCLCDPSYARLNPTEEVCYRMASNVDEPCEEHPGQCGNLKEASCDNGLCKCNPGAVFIHGKCHHQSPLGGMCEFPEECMAGSNENAYCNSAKICACMPGTIQRDGKCYVQKKIGDSCVEDEECKVVILGGVYCDTNNLTCSCMEGYEANANGEACDGQSGLRAVGLFLLIGLLAVFSVNS